MSVQRGFTSHGSITTTRPSWRCGLVCRRNPVPRQGRGPAGGVGGDPRRRV